jgi:hypothetical protein
MYLTSPQAHDSEHIRRAATKIFEAILKRDGGSTYHFERLDLYGLPLPAGLPEDERVAQCVAHQKKEVAMRNATGESDFFIPPTSFDDCYERNIWIIDKPEEAWREREWDFVQVEFDYKPDDKDVTLPQDPVWYRLDWEESVDPMYFIRSQIPGYYANYIDCGCLDKDLKRYSAVVAETGKYYGTWAPKQVRIGRDL